jgi:hypothetical protein
MTKDKVFTMRTDHVFRANLTWLSNEMGLTKAGTVELVVNMYPELVKAYQKHQKLLKELKANI